MRIGTIQASSQADKNEMLFRAVQKYAADSETINFGCRAGESSRYSYIDISLLAGMLLGPVFGGVAAGLGSAIYDAFAGYDVLNVLITFVSKFAMAYVCGLIVRKGNGKQRDYTLIGSIAGALTYVALYMLKTAVYGAIAGNV